MEVSLSVKNYKLEGFRPYISVHTMVCSKVLSRYLIQLEYAIRRIPYRYHPSRIQKLFGIALWGFANKVERFS
jgi:hypothetical protein